MSPSEHLLLEQLERLAAHALDADATARAQAHLAGCAMCRTQLEVLQSDGLDRTLPGRTHVALGQNTLPDSPRANPVTFPRGTTFGRYLLLEKLGAGGMGEVYAAYDPQLNRKVALKLMRPGSGSTQDGRSRLLREAQSLARVAHPNVIAVHDVGEFGEHVFVAMELIEGVTLTDWLRELHPWPTVLEMFIAAGRGLAAAHQAGLVHRDFKPDNVLVGDGRPRVLDFGLARATGDVAPPGTGETGQSPDSPVFARLTLDGAILGTPGYMAPEQCEGKPTDPRTDQFSFCVALFEALYGTRPFGGNTLSARLAEVKRGRLPEPPKSSNIPRAVYEALRRGLSPAPPDRFPDMAALLAALSVRRRRSRGRWLAAVTTLAVLASAGGGYGLWLRRRLEVCGGLEQKLAGTWDAEVAKDVRRAFLATGKPHAKATFDAVERTLAAYARQWIDASAQSCEAARIRGIDSEAIYTLKSWCLEDRRSQLHALTGLFAAADEDILTNAQAATRSLPNIAACNDAVTLRERAGTATPATRARAAPAAAKLLEAKALHDAGKYARGVVAAKEALDEAQKLGDRVLEAESHLLLGRLLDQAGDARQAEATLLDAAMTAVAAGSDELALRAWSRLVTVTGRTETQRDDAHRWARLARATLTRIGARPDLEAELESALGDLALSESRAEAALESYERARTAYERARDSEHPELAMAYYGIGVAQTRLGKLDVAAENLERAIDLLVRAVGTEHPQMASALTALGAVYARQGNLAAAFERQEAALRTREAMLGPEHPEVAASYQSLATLRTKLGQDREAAEAHAKALAIRQKVFGQEHLSTAESYTFLAAALMRLEDWPGAATHAQRALAIYQRQLGSDHPSTAGAHEYLGQALQGLGQLLRAQKEHELALDQRLRTLGADHVNVARSHRALGEILLARGEQNLALLHFQKSLDIRERTNGRESTTLGKDLIGVGRCQLALAAPAKAVAPLERALALLESTADEREVSRVRFDLARALWESRQDRQRSLELAAKARATFLDAGEHGKTELSLVETWLRGKRAAVR